MNFKDKELGDCILKEQKNYLFIVSYTLFDNTKELIYNVFSSDEDKAKKMLYNRVKVDLGSDSVKFVNILSVYKKDIDHCKVIELVK